MELISLSWTLMPSVSSMLVKVLTPLPPDQDQVLCQAMVVPLRETRLAQSEPVAPEMPHWSRLRMYGLAVTVSHWPQWLEVSMAVARGDGAAHAAASSGRRARAREGMVNGADFVQVLETRRLRRRALRDGEGVIYMRGDCIRDGCAEVPMVNASVPAARKKCIERASLSRRLLGRILMDVADAEETIRRVRL